MRKVFGIGWAKTGTSTLGRCLSILGYRHQSQDLGLVKDVDCGDLSRIIKIASLKDSFEDWPWLLLYRQMDEAFPGSKFILTERSPDRWIKSYRNMLKNQGRASKELNEIRRVLYNLPFPHVTEEQLIERYVTHNNAVKSYFKDRDADLLVINWEKDANWSTLCAFLDTDIPKHCFPHENKGYYYSKKSLLVRRIIKRLKLIC